MNNFSETIMLETITRAPATVDEDKALAYVADTYNYSEGAKLLSQTRDSNISEEAKMPYLKDSSIKH